MSKESSADSGQRADFTQMELLHIELVLKEKIYGEEAGFTDGGIESIKQLHKRIHRRLCEKQLGISGKEYDALQTGQEPEPDVLGEMGRRTCDSCERQHCDCCAGTKAIDTVLKPNMN